MPEEKKKKKDTGKVLDPHFKKPLIDMDRGSDKPKTKQKPNKVE